VAWFFENDILSFPLRMRGIILTQKTTTMLRWTITFIIIAIIAGILGFTGIAAGAAEIAKIIFFIFIVLLVISLIMGRRSNV